jgi:hypothetical protein
VDANAEWSVAENSLWFNAIKESNTRITINYLDNISVFDKEGTIEVTTRHLMPKCRSYKAGSQGIPD